jgi:hypothetical protein
MERKTNGSTEIMKIWGLNYNQDELMANWELVINGEQPYKIDPL